MRKVIILLIDIMVFGLLCVSGFLVYGYFHDKQAKEKPYEQVQQVLQKQAKETTKTEDTGEEIKVSQETHQERKQENADYICTLVFDTGLIDYPVVKGDDNTTYLQTNFLGNYDVWGSIFMDYQGAMLDDNVVIYGHASVGNKNDNHMFSQLQNMDNQDFVNNNRNFSLYYDGVIQDYEIVYTSVVDVLSDTWPFTQNNFRSKTEKEEWLTLAKLHTLTQPETDVSVDDTFCTLQTCAENDGGKRYVIIAKRIQERNY